MSLAFSPLEEYYLRLEPQRTRRRQAVLLQIRDQIYGSSVKVSTSEFFLLFGCWKPLFRSKFLDQIRIQSPLQFGVKQFNHPIWCCPQSITFQTETIGPFFLEKEKKRIENYLKIVVIIFTLLLLALFLRCVPLALELWFLVYTKIMWILCISQVFWTCYYGLSLLCNLRVSWRSELVRMFLINSSPYTSNTAKRCTWVVFFSVARP